MKCNHTQHVTPEIRAVLGGQNHPVDMDLLRATGMLADKCVECGVNIKDLCLLNRNESRKVLSLRKINNAKE